jgi:hypothetical protein
MEVYKSKSAIPSLKSGSIKGIQGTLGATVTTIATLIATLMRTLVAL